MEPSLRDLRRSPLVPLLAVAVALFGAAGCAGHGRDPSVPEGSLAPYSPEAAVLFDDVLAPAVFGFDPEGRDPARDPKLRERTRLAEFVAVARVETVSRVGGVEHRGAYEVTLEPLGSALAGNAPEAPIVLNVPATNPSYAWVDGAGAGWVGTQLVVFVRHYEDGPTVALHFRCEPDTPELRAAVNRNAGLRLLR